MLKINTLLFFGGLLDLAAVAGIGTPARAAQQYSLDTPSLPPAALRCAALRGMAVEAGIVVAAESFSGASTISGGATPGATASANFCRTRIQLRPSPSSEINVEVWLPEDWNRKLMGIGGGGFDGSLSAGSTPHLNRSISQGYAAVVTDVGHQSGAMPEKWAYRQPEKVIDFGHRGNHLAAIVAKQIIETYYGTPAQRAYFVGCSNGGREGIMEISRYPEDYDAVVAGAPALRYTEVVTQLLWYNQAIRGPGGASTLSSKQSLVHDAIVKKCDGLDGVKDGILENPQQCRFDPAGLQCKGNDSPDCLTPAEESAFRRIYSGPRLKSGKLVIHGPALGSEGVPENWAAWVTGPMAAMAGQEFYRWMVHGDPSWKAEAFDLDRDYPVARARVAPIIDADNPDISAFIRRGGKLILYQGWDDPAITGLSTIKYYEDALRLIGHSGADQVRLFMVPGMMHCGGGPGATSFDMQAVLEKWDEQGNAPERVVATNPVTTITRPLCAWPKVARYDGYGSTREASNFTCKLGK